MSACGCINLFPSRHKIVFCLDKNLFYSSEKVEKIIGRYVRDLSKCVTYKKGGYRVLLKCHGGVTGGGFSPDISAL